MLKFFRSAKRSETEHYETVVQGLKQMYLQKLLPLEKHYKFHEFHSPAIEEADFDALPMILLIGQYSTGKTTFIRHLLETDFPGMRIGPEPTTDRFIVIMNGERESTIPGNALVVDPSKQFRPLSKFGNNFLNRFQCSTIPNNVLESITFVDTPGILSGEKQRLDRGYNFSGVIEWFAEHVDRIILLFDAHKLDISDEFRRVIESLKGYEDKIRIVLNKADSIDSQQLMRVYGALMWSLGKVLGTPEVARVYIGSFWDHPLLFDSNRKLFELESKDFIHDLQTLPCNVAVRKLNDIIRRARLAKVHAYILSHLRAQMPSLIGKESKKKELIHRLDQTYEAVAREHNISIGDFPKLEKMKELLLQHDFKTFHPLNQKMIDRVDEMLATDIGKLMELLPKENMEHAVINHLKGGVFEGDKQNNPFGYGASDGINEGRFIHDDWVVNSRRDKYDKAFQSCNPTRGRVTGAAAKEYMMKSKLPFGMLGKIWKLSDIDQDGFLDADEFALACYLIDLKLDGDEIPGILPPHLIPPSKREDTAAALVEMPEMPDLVS